MEVIIIQNPADRGDAIRQALRQSRLTAVARCAWINGYTACAVTLTNSPSPWVRNALANQLPASDRTNGR